MKKNVYNLIILDESGSMESIKRAAVDGVNETIQTIKSAQTKYSEIQNHFITLVTFNSEKQNTLYDNVPIAEAKLLPKEDFRPDCCTPLYDAMGTSLCKLRNQLPKNEDNNVLVTIITDGMENASREYTGKMIKQLIDELKAQGWIFAYIGANQDVEKMAEQMGIIGNTLSFEADDDGVKALFLLKNQSRDRYYKTLADNDVEAIEKIQENFFKADEDEEKEDEDNKK
ncbi:MAG: VWA domain-containing protein [Prevotellaceae bacterium]|jgi:Mg-chelatase subunit ChlD|nr:VWA domain-containing protein [Prevotellaceae bacterium]